MTFGQFIRQKRIKAKLSQKTLADYLGYNSRETISYLETGRQHWRVDHLPKLAKLFGVLMAELIQEWDDIEPVHR